MTTKLISRTSPEPGLIKLTLCRPDAFNALSEEMLESLMVELKQLATSSSDKVVIIGAEGKAFSAGHDLKQMRSEPSLDYYENLFEKCSQVMLAIQRLPQIVIAQVQGIATAAGCQLVAMCDLAVANEHARFAVSGVNLGLFCSTPSVALSRNISRKQAMYMLVTGEFISARQAQDWGLINEVTTAEDLDATTFELARKILAKPAPALHMGKHLFYEQIEANISHAYQLASETMASNMMDNTALEGVQAFIDKRPPKW